MSQSPREKSRKKAKIMKELITELDAIRSLKLFNTSHALRYLSELKLEGELWKEVTQALKKIALMPTEDKSFPKIRRIDSISDILFMVSFAGMIGALVLLLLNLEPVVSYLVLLLTLIVLNISYFMKFYVSMRLRNIYLSRSQEIEAYNDLLRKAIDNLVSRLRGEIKKAGIEAKEVEFKLHNGDYTGLVVVEKKGGVYKLKFK